MLKDKVKISKQCKKVENVLVYIWEVLYYICTFFHSRLYKCSVTFSNNENIRFHSLIYWQPWWGNLYLRNLQQKLDQQSKPMFVAANKMYVELLPNELKDLRRLERILTYMRILFTKTSIVHRKVNLQNWREIFSILQLSLKMYVIFYWDLSILMACLLWN